MRESADIFDGLLALREALAEYSHDGVQLEPATVCVFVATIDCAISAYEIEKRERAFDELIRCGAAVLEQKRKKPIKAYISAPVGPGMGGAAIYQFRRRAATSSPSNGGDAA